MVDHRGDCREIIAFHLVEMSESKDELRCVSRTYQFAHIHQLFTQFGMVQEEIAKILKTSKTAVNHNIRAFGAMKDKYLRAFPGPGAVRKFSYFLELYKKPELR